MEKTNRMFEELHRSDSIAKFLREHGGLHPDYCHYTTLPRFKQMMESKTIWLTRCDSPDFDDTIEQRKYGCPEVQKSLYFACFSHTSQENAAMWGLYCPPTYQALRITIPRRYMNMLSRSSCCAIRSECTTASEYAVLSRGVGDIGYASVSDGDGHDRSNTLFWDGHYTRRLDNLRDRKNAEHLTGFAKDAEWSFERESRLWVKLREECEAIHVALCIPDVVIRNMKFTISPWLYEYEKSFVKDCIRKWISRAVSGTGEKIQINDSVLSGGLRKWAQQRRG